MGTYTSLSVPFLRDNPPIALLQNHYPLSFNPTAEVHVYWNTLNYIQGNRNNVHLVF